MDDYITDFETPCPHCGNHTTHRRDCGRCEGGLIDGHDEDPMWFDVGATYTCSECRGKGGFHWCPNCGEDVDSPKPKQLVQPSCACRFPDAGQCYESRYPEERGKCECSCHDEDEDGYSGWDQ